MKAIVIGAGRGQRLMPHTADAPKCLAEVGGRAILDWILEAFAANGLAEVVFIGGYRIEKVRAAYPQLAYRENAAWERNNILASLMCAEQDMDGPFLCCYADTLFTAGVVRGTLASGADIALVVDTEWRSRYALRTQHPPDDAEKVTVRDGLVTRVHRGIAEADAHGEFIGLAAFSAAGARLLREHYRRAALPPNAYLIHLFQEMIEQGLPVAHVDVAGGYMEIDTQQDFELARQFWKP